MNLHNCDEDPEFVFMLWSNLTRVSAAHVCMGMPSMANLNSSSQQGRRIAIEGSVTTNLTS